MLLDGFLRSTLLALVIALPWFFGGVAPLFRLIVAALLAALMALVLFRRASTRAWSATIPQVLVLSAACGLGAAQLSDSVAEALDGASSGIAIRREFADTPDGVASTSPAPISLHPPATRRDLTALASGFAAFLLGAALFAETRPLIWIMSALAGVGGATAFFGIVQQLSWNGLVYWTFSPRGGQAFGPFINRNNAGGFLEITLAAAVGLLLWRILSIPPLAPTTDLARFVPAPPSATRRAAWLAANLNGSILAAAAAAILIAAGIALSLSRGSFVVLIVGLLTALFLTTLALRRFIYAVVPAVIIAVALGFTAWLGQNQIVYDRLATLFTTTGLAEDSRFSHWRTALRAAQDFWLTGSGLGTYRYAYTRYQEQPTATTFYYAENQYLDALVSGGAPGLTLFLSSVGLLGFSALRLLRYSRTSADYGIASTALLLFTMQGLHACFDFAMYVPAHFVPFAMLCGAIMRRAATCRNPAPSHETIETPSYGARAATFALGTVVVVALIAGADELRRANVVRQAEFATRSPSGNSNARNLDEVDQLLNVQHRAVEVCPDDGEARTRLAELWLERYEVAVRREIGNFPVSPAVMLWTRPEKAYAEAHLMARTWNESGLEALRRNPLIVENLQPALAEARRARQACPLSPYPHMIVAKLCFLDESPLNDLFYLDRVERLVGGRENWLFEIGTLHLDAARPERAFAAWRRCLQLAPTHEAQIIFLAAGFLTTEQLLAKVLPDSPEDLVRIADKYYASQEQRRDRERILRRAAQLLNTVTAPTTAQLRLRGFIEAELGNKTEAVRWYERALARDGLRADWFFEAASLYASMEDWASAARYARQARVLSPYDARYRALLERAEKELTSRSTRTTGP